MGQCIGWAMEQWEQRMPRQLDAQTRQLVLQHANLSPEDINSAFISFRSISGGRWYISLHRFRRAVMEVCHSADMVSYESFVTFTSNLFEIFDIDAVGKVSFTGFCTVYEKIDKKTLPKENIFGLFCSGDNFAPKEKFVEMISLFSQLVVLKDFHVAECRLVGEAAARVCVERAFASLPQPHEGLHLEGFIDLASEHSLLLDAPYAFLEHLKTSFRIERL
eukprot:TRINITY_DN16223_c0_g1_i1.p1 TRINITY_DN16223_c0_g1~~TRINITY_DN16223_c0_g1_i1.p1  ORF type:complete len:220 (+),score=45.17 TRINITY_DN16223_c0_g1_i1:71-730(+)